MLASAMYEVVMYLCGPKSSTDSCILLWYFEAGFEIISIIIINIM